MGYSSTPRNNKTAPGYNRQRSNSKTDGLLINNNHDYAATESLKRAQHARKKKRKGRIALSVLGCFLALILVFGIGAISYISSINNSFNDFGSEEDRQSLLSTLTPSYGDGYYVAILGSDARDNEVSRSDVIMLAHINEKTGTVALVSIPRDMMISLEDHGIQKINAAYTYGGPALAVHTISEFAGVPISHYVEVHFDEFETVIDSLGGITVNVPESFRTDAGVFFSAGEQTLSGEKALILARERHNVSGGDTSRATAQRAIVEGLANKVLSSSPADLPGIVSNLTSCVTTDYSVSDLVSLAQSIQGTGLTMHSGACPSYYFESDSLIYAGVMYDEWQDMMKRVDAGINPGDTVASIPEPQASNKKLGAASNAASPRDYQSIIVEQESDEV